jgi:hypothetical protein
MRLTRVSLSLGLSIAAAALLACRKNPLVLPANTSPQAVAKADAAEYPQAPATVKLDGTGSTDDGAIATYQWFSATEQTDGGGRLVPEGQSLNWPDDQPTVDVQLPEGIWTFALWVTDDEGVIGAPAYVTVIVGDPPRPVAGAGAAGGGAAGRAGGAGGS